MDLRRPFLKAWLSASAALLCTASAFAGMASPLPANPERYLRLTENAEARLQAISFFVVGFLLAAAAVQGLWNWVRRDVHWLPRLSFGKALAAVFLWGMLFILVLAMVAGARELMTPGAWRKEGFTYRLVTRPAQTASPHQQRRDHLENLRTALWQFAATHQRRFPTGKEAGQVAAPLWDVPAAPGLRYVYLAGLKMGSPPTILAYEPELDANDRLVLHTDGTIVSMTSADIQTELHAGAKP